MWFWLLFLCCYPSQLVQISLLIVNVSTETKTQINTEIQQFSEVWSSQDAQEGRQQRNLVLFHAYMKAIGPQVVRAACSGCDAGAELRAAGMRQPGTAASPAAERATGSVQALPSICSQPETSLSTALTLPIQPKCRFQP